MATQENGVLQPGPASIVSSEGAFVLASVRDFFKSGLTRSLEWRERQLQGILTMLRDRQEDMVAALAADLRRNREDALMEVCGCARNVEHLLSHFRGWAQPQEVPSPDELQPCKSYVVHEPHGVALVISPWNFPLVLSLDPIAAAICAGNAVVLKPSDLSPTSTSLLARLLPAYVDGRAVRVVEGGAEAGRMLLSLHWDKIFFTGGTAIGRLVMAAAAQYLTPVTMELGGKNPVFVDDTVDLKATANRLISARCLNAGQFCGAPDYVLVVQGVVNPLVAALKSAILETFGADALRSPDLGRIVSDGHFKRVQRVLTDPCICDCVAFGGQVDATDRVICPTLLVNVPWEAAIMQEEVFAPILAIQPVAGTEEAIDIINSKPKPLVIHVFTEERAVFEQFLARTSSGIAIRNDTFVFVANPDLPFGGVGASGMGSYHGKKSFVAFSHQKSVMERILPN